MQQLSGLDASFLNLETPTQRGHVGGVVVVDPATAPDGWGFDTVRSLIEERIELLPFFRRRLLSVPMEMDHPYWVEDPDFDLDFHLRHIGVPAPGGREELATLVARIHERPLDRSRPLWEMYLIEGLDGGRMATYTKLHHAAIDGVSGAEILTILLDASPEGRDLPEESTTWEPEAVPSPTSLMWRTAFRVAVSPARALRVGYEFARAIPGLKPLQSLPALVGVGRDREEFLSRPSLIAPQSLLNQPISAHRRWAFGDIALDRVKAIKNATGATVNDVVISVSAGAVRRWLDDHGNIPERSLQALIPI
ncbi:MAG: wax ester/triacylglycerol synthase family O-acyltransferase, partial [Acidimicrobiia bacterium]|nr:wax ester/triacylglycerol synthase family O-acyltransferase [Acidimicrobiia bacterium]